MLKVNADLSVRTIAESGTPTIGAFRVVWTLFARSIGGVTAGTIPDAASRVLAVEVDILAAVLSVETITDRRIALGNSSGVTTMTIAVSTNARKKRLFIYGLRIRNGQGTGSYPPDRKG